MPTNTTGGARYGTPYLHYAALIVDMADDHGREYRDDWLPLEYKRVKDIARRHPEFGRVSPTYEAFRKYVRRHQNEIEEYIAEHFQEVDRSTRRDAAREVCREDEPDPVHAEIHETFQAFSRGGDAWTEERALEEEMRVEPVPNGTNDVREAANEGMESLCVGFGKIVADLVSGARGAPERAERFIAALPRTRSALAEDIADVHRAVLARHLEQER